MGKRHYWVGYKREGETIEIKVKDFSGAVIESYECDIQDKKTSTKILKILKEKYGFNPQITKKILDDKDMKWLK